MIQQDIKNHLALDFPLSAVAGSLSSSRILALALFGPARFDFNFRAPSSNQRSIVEDSTKQLTGYLRLHKNPRYLIAAPMANRLTELPRIVAGKSMALIFTNSRQPRHHRLTPPRNYYHRYQKRSRPLYLIHCHTHYIPL